MWYVFVSVDMLCYLVIRYLVTFDSTVRNKHQTSQFLIINNSCSASSFQNLQPNNNVFVFQREIKCLQKTNHIVSSFSKCISDCREEIVMAVCE